MTGLFSSPDFRLPRDAVCEKRLSDPLGAGSIHSSSPTDSLKRVSTSIPEMSTAGTWSFFGNPHLLLAQQDFGRSARSFIHAGSQPSLALTLFFSAKVWLQTMFCGAASAPLRRLLTNSGRASSGCLQEFPCEVLPINVEQGGSVIWAMTAMEE